MHGICTAWYYPVSVPTNGLRTYPIHEKEKGYCTKGLFRKSSFHRVYYI